MRRNIPGQSWLGPRRDRMASVFEGDVKKNLLERTEAEKVFRPWWDTLEDYLLNILIVLGQITITVFSFQIKKELQDFLEKN